MTHAIAALWTRALRLLPASGRHRAPLAPAAGPRSAAAVEQPLAPLCGEEIGLVRPYLVAHENRLQAQRAVRRRSLRLVPQGLRIGVRR